MRFSRTRSSSFCIPSKCLSTESQSWLGPQGSYKPPLYLTRRKWNQRIIWFDQNHSQLWQRQGQKWQLPLSPLRIPFNKSHDHNGLLFTEHHYALGTAPNPLQMVLVNSYIKFRDHHHWHKKEKGLETVMYTESQKRSCPDWPTNSHTLTCQAMFTLMLFMYLLVVLKACNLYFFTYQNQIKY